MKDVRIVKVPIDFIDDFKKDPDRALRDISGVATLAINPLIRKRDRLNKIMDRSRVYPFTKSVISISTEDTIELSDYLDLSKLVKVIGSTYVPLVRPDAKRLAHFDLSLRHCSTGICIGHTYFDYVKNLPVLYIDVILEVKPPDEGEIDFEKVRNFTINMEELGFHFGIITYDGWESRDSIQRLKRHFGPTDA